MTTIREIIDQCPALCHVWAETLEFYGDYTEDKNGPKDNLVPVAELGVTDLLHSLSRQGQVASAVTNFTSIADCLLSASPEVRLAIFFIKQPVVFDIGSFNAMGVRPNGSRGDTIHVDKYLHINVPRDYIHVVRKVFASRTVPDGRWEIVVRPIEIHEELNPRITVFVPEPALALLQPNP